MGQRNLVADSFRQADGVLWDGHPRNTLKQPWQEIGDTETKSGLVLRWLPQQGSVGTGTVNGLLRHAAVAARIEWHWNCEWLTAKL